LTHVQANGKVVEGGNFPDFHSAPGLHNARPGGSLATKVFVMATLEVCNESDGSRYYELTADETLVGRDQFCDIVLRNHTVSRQHARIVRTSDGFFIEDLASLNGTYLNSHRLEARTPIKDKDRIQIYEVVTIFHEVAPVVAPASEPPGSGEAKTHMASAPPKIEAPPEPAHEVVAQVPAVDPAADSGGQARFRAALRVSLDLEGENDVDEILPKVLDSLFDLFPQAVRGYVLLAEGADGHLVPRAIKHRKSESGQSMTFGPISRKTALHVMSTGEAILMDDGPPAGSSEVSQSVFDIRCLSMICAPLMGPSRRPLGILYLDATDPQNRFDQEDLDVLAAVASVAGGHVESASAMAAHHDAGGHQAQLGTAKQVQLQFLPQRRPEVAGYQFYDHYQPANEVGGDYYGYIPLSDGRLALTIGDVAGKGVSAALLMAHFCSEVRYHLATAPTPADAVKRLNQDLSSETQNYHFVTFALCVLDPATHRMTLVNAGHLPPLLKRGREVEPLGAVESGMPLGCEAQRDYQQIEVPLEPGDMVVLYTDGISEAMNAQGEVYGSQRIRQALAKAPLTVERMGEVVLDDVRRFVGGRLPSDDICLVCFGRKR
jgi:sigma-B regulation protein RsbU (phosphoserine phosphatase)